MATGERSIISQLEENTTYYFKIQSQYDDEDGLQSDVSDPISTIEYLCKFCMRLNMHQICWYALVTHYLAALLAIGPPPKYLYSIIL